MFTKLKWIDVEPISSSINPTQSLSINSQDYFETVTLNWL